MKGEQKKKKKEKRIRNDIKTHSKAAFSMCVLGACVCGVASDYAVPIYIELPVYTYRVPYNMQLVFYQLC